MTRVEEENVPSKGIKILFKDLSKRPLSFLFFFYIPIVSRLDESITVRSKETKKRQELYLFREDLSSLHDFCSTKSNVSTLVIIGQQPEAISFNVLAKLICLQELWLIECKLKVSPSYIFLYILFFSFLFLSSSLSSTVGGCGGGGTSFAFPFLSFSRLLVASSFRTYPLWKNARNWKSFTFIPTKSNEFQTSRRYHDWRFFRYRETT